MKKKVELSRVTPFGIMVKKKILDSRLTQTEFCRQHEIPVSRLSDALYGRPIAEKFRKKIIEVLELADEVDTNNSKEAV